MPVYSGSCHCGRVRFRVEGINVRCLEGVDLDSLRIERVYGSRLP